MSSDVDNHETATEQNVQLVQLIGKNWGGEQIYVGERWPLVVKAKIPMNEAILLGFFGAFGATLFGILAFLIFALLGVNLMGIGY